jgi:hypothetical protein
MPARFLRDASANSEVTIEYKHYHGLQLTLLQDLKCCTARMPEQRSNMYRGMKLSDVHLSPTHTRCSMMARQFRLLRCLFVPVGSAYVLVRNQSLVWYVFPYQPFNQLLNLKLLSSQIFQQRSFEHRLMQPLCPPGQTMVFRQRMLLNPCINAIEVCMGELAVLHPSGLSRFGE